MISIVLLVETMDQSSVVNRGWRGWRGTIHTSDGWAMHMHAVHRRRRCINALSTFCARAACTLIVPTSKIGDRIHIIMEGPCSISHVTHRVTASHGQRLGILRSMRSACTLRMCAPLPAIGPRKDFTQRQPSLPFGKLLVFLGNRLNAR